MLLKLNKEMKRTMKGKNRSKKTSLLITLLVSIGVFSLFSCVLNEGAMPYVAYYECTKNSHYDLHAGDYKEFVTLRYDGLEDTLTECTLTFGNHTNKVLVVNDFPISFFSKELKDTSSWYNILKKNEERIPLSILYQMQQEEDGNTTYPHKGRFHEVIVSPAQKTLEIGVLCNNRKVTLAVEVENKYEMTELGTTHRCIGLRLNLENIIDEEKNDTIRVGKFRADSTLTVTSTHSEGFY